MMHQSPDCAYAHAPLRNARSKKLVQMVTSGLPLPLIGLEYTPEITREASCLLSHLDVAQFAFQLCMIVVVRERNFFHVLLANFNKFS